ncbi:MAG: hypothetical protein GXP63_06860 [DPANN group archaeon]|nr:hypothetical protein [DPANN group archaeon]
MNLRIPPLSKTCRAAKPGTMAVLLFVLVLLLLSGCSKLSSNNAITPTRENICTDNGGLRVSFLDNMPPKQIFEGDQFYIGVMLKNDGCFPISEGYVTLGGYDADVTSISSGDRQKILYDLEGKTVYTPEGGRAEMIFEAKNKKIRFKIPEATETFSVNTCYTYQTIATAQVCINPNRPDVMGMRNDVCEAGKIILDQKQGSPVIVDSVKSTTVRSGDRIEVNFDIKVKNIGKGHVRDYADGTCQGNASVSLSEVSFSDRSTENEGKATITCVPSKIALSTNDEKNLFRCKATFSDSFAAFTSLLVMRLDYAYTQTTDKTILIKKI